MAGASARGDIMQAMRPWMIALTVLTACGPVAYIGQVTRDASTKVARARELEAEKYSPYWYTRATVYLRMAREVAAHADFQGANHFGRLSAEAADKAIFEVENPEKRPRYETADTPIAPAKVDEDTDKVAPAKE